MRYQPDSFLTSSRIDRREPAGHRGRHELLSKMDASMRGAGARHESGLFAEEITRSTAIAAIIRQSDIFVDHHANTYINVMTWYMSESHSGSGHGPRRVAGLAGRRGRAQKRRQTWTRMCCRTNYVCETNSHIHCRIDSPALAAPTPLTMIRLPPAAAGPSTVASAEGPRGRRRIPL